MDAPTPSQAPDLTDTVTDARDAVCCAGPDDCATDVCPSGVAEPTDRGGRPPSTSAHALAAAAQRLFLVDGFEQTSVEDIARAAGVSRRTFFRYFRTKADVVWVESGREFEAFVASLDAAPPEAGVRAVLVDAWSRTLDHGRDEDEWARHRAQLILIEPGVQAQANAVFREWRAVVARFVARRIGESPDDLVPLAFAHAGVSASAVGHQYWFAHPEMQLGDCLRAALEVMLPPEPTPAARAHPRPTCPV